MSTRPPLNGVKTHPLTSYSWEVLGQLARADFPRQEFNAGVVNRLERDELVEVFLAPSPYASHIGQDKKIAYLRITEAGRAALKSKDGGSNGG